MPKQITTFESVDLWQPTAGLTWQWQLTSRLDLQTDVIDIDLHERGKTLRQGRITKRGRKGTALDPGRSRPASSAKRYLLARET